MNNQQKSNFTFFFSFSFWVEEGGFFDFCLFMFLMFFFWFLVLFCFSLFFDFCLVFFLTFCPFFFLSGFVEWSLLSFFFLFFHEVIHFCQTVFHSIQVFYLILIRNHSHKELDQMKKTCSQLSLFFFCVCSHPSTCERKPFVFGCLLTFFLSLFCCLWFPVTGRGLWVVWF